MRLTTPRHRPHPHPAPSRRAAPRRPGTPAPAPQPTHPRSATAATHHRAGSRCAGFARTTGTPVPARARRGAHRRRDVLLIGWLVALGVLLTSSTARAETVQIVALAQTVEQVFTNIRNLIMGILAGAALVLFTVAGLRYLLASGDPGEIEKAKGAFKAGCIGFGLAALAPLVVEMLKTIVGGV